MNEVHIVRIVTSPISIYYLLKNQFLFLKTKQIRVRLITAPSRINKKIEREESCEILEVPLTRRFSLYKDLVSLVKIYYLLISLKPDIVQTQTPKANILGITAALLAGCKIRIVTNGGHPLVVKQKWLRSFFLAMLERIIYRFATHIWANSLSLYEMIISRNLAPARKVEIIGEYGSSNGIDLNRFNPENLHPKIIDEIKRKIAYARDCFYLLTIGRLVSEKGIEEMVEVFEMIKDRRQNVKLILIGSFEDHIDRIDDRIKKKIKADPDIIKIDWSDQVEYYFHIADLYVHPSHREGFPQVLLQAGAMRCPVVCSNAPGNIDLILDRQDGVLFKRKDKKDLHDKISWAMDNKDDLIQYAENLYTKIKERYDQKLVHEKIFIRYREILNDLRKRKQ